MNWIGKCLIIAGLILLSVFIAIDYIKKSEPRIRREYIVTPIYLPAKEEVKKPVTVVSPGRKEKIDSVIRVAAKRDSLKALLADRLSEKKAVFPDSIEAKDSLGSSFRMIEIHSITYDGLADSLRKRTEYKDVMFKSVIQYIKEEMTLLQKVQTVAWLSATVILILKLFKL